MLLLDAPRRRVGPALVALLWAASPASAQERVLEGGTRYLRAGSVPEWSETAAHPHARTLSVPFTAPASATEQTLTLHQSGVKETWRVLLNGREIALLHQDENAMVAYWPVPPGLLVAGQNVLRIEPADTLADDIAIGPIALRESPRREVLSESSLEVQVVDDSGEPLPARVTITDPRGVLQEVDGGGGAGLAVRPGFVYTGTGRASIGLPAGSYRVYAGRGFEYGVDSTRLVLGPGERAERTLRIRREVPTDGWISADPHVHTLTHSGHGDATVEERVLTIAGEGIELPILTDHNVHADLEPAAQDAGIRGHFTPVIGNELTTRVGHFNVFPLSVATPAPPASITDWEAASRVIRATPGVQGIVLNHARDVHGGFRPFGPERHIAVAGMSLDGWFLPANAMEVVNSGAQLTDPMRLFTDWFGMLNRGHLLTPVGASDSHDVGRYLLGQARTYIRVPDEEPGRIDVPLAMERFRSGAVMVSFGLLAELRVDGRYGPGDLVRPGNELQVSVRVLGPAWTRAETVTLYANGREIRTAPISDRGAPGVKWAGSWTLPRPAHDVHLVAIAVGPGGQHPFWPIAKPYQATSPETNPRVIGSSGAVWIDADGDGRRTDAHTYASRLLSAAASDLGGLVQRLADYDEAVAVQTAGLLLERGIPPTRPEVTAALGQAAPATRRGFEAFTREWLASERLRRSAPP